jgi:predicted GNAT family acetyltransferase
VSEAELVSDRAESRYEWRIDGHLAAYAEYIDDGTVTTFTHTVTLPAMRGQGIAGELVRRALDDAREAGRRVVAQCWYVAQFIREHPEYADLVAR